MTTRAARHPQPRDLAEAEPRTAPRRRRPAGQPAPAVASRPRAGKLRIAAFLAVSAVIVAGGLYFAGRSFFAPSARAASAGTIDLRVSMAGFEPGTIHARPGETLTINWWNTDAAPHLEGGVHTLVSESLGIRLALDAESSKTIQIKAPMQPGEYDYWCDSCCGGKANPGMHARIVVEA